MQKRFRYKHFRWLCAAVLCTVCLSPPVHQLTSVPTSIQVPLGGQAIVPLHLPKGSKVATSNVNVFSVSAVHMQGSNASDVEVYPKTLGSAYVSTRLFGFLPWKTVEVHVIPKHNVYVAGQSVGIRLKSRGVMVVGYQRIGRERASPAVGADIRLGDVIEEVNSHQVSSAEDVRRFVQHADGELKLLVRRGDAHRNVVVTPASDERGERHLGLFVREKTSGVGTLTYYDPQTHRFGALGHVISDADTGQPIVGQGTLYDAEVTGMVKGLNGRPGEKHGRFVESRGKIGRIESNTPYGVFGTMSNQPGDLVGLHPLPVALPQDVHEGPATMLTVIHGRKVEAFDVEVENLVRQQKPATKSMIVHVVDKRLLSLSGGIIQGMSGSPLVQDGKLIGAVTHVFVSDPTRGYGVYAAWMLEQGEHGTVDATDRTARAAWIHN